ncbi:MAG TPA: alpha-glucosidase C-terminal domain-containing protein [Blastocatellia bacterium]|nr:alpha-glucosidase C-terminal domain-containing protein [Blastocatellia bacterium]
MRALARLRAEREPLRRGALVNLYVGDQQYAYARVNDRDSVIVVLNNDSKPATVEFSVAPAKLANGVTLKDLLGELERVTVNKGSIRVTLPARGAGIFSQK